MQQAPPGGRNLKISKLINGVFHNPNKTIPENMNAMGETKKQWAIVSFEKIRGNWLNCESSLVLLHISGMKADKNIISSVHGPLNISQSGPTRKIF